ncbi:MAG TPA: hypothetical protein VKT77_15120, partial [Chthonomonadaceae bacterium]|nr:hypothetical protein [Chthonomonadaceae bacterium]
APAVAQESPFSTQDPLARALQTDPVYVGKTLRDQIDGSALEQIAQHEPPDRPMKIAVLETLPQTGRVYGTGARYAKALHDYLGLGRGTLLIVTKRGPFMATDALSTNQIDDILRHESPMMQRDPVHGIQAAAYDVDSLVSGGQAPGTANHPQTDGSAPVFAGVILFVIVAALMVGVFVAVIVAIARASGKSAAMKAARAPIARLRGQVVDSLTYVDTYLDLLPESADAASARSERQSAAALLEQAAAFARTARSAADLGRAEALLEQASQSAGRARAAVDRATGGTGMAVGLDGTEFKATPVNQNGTPNMIAAPVIAGLNAEDIPPSERAACFFCSRPARLRDLTPVTAAIGGQRRKVLACAQDVEAIQQGAAPAVRTVQVGGKAVPWYRAPAYDPYRDYGYAVGYDPYYGYGYGSGVLDGIFLAEMLSDPAPFAYPVFVNPSGYATTDPGQAVVPDIAPDLQGAGSADFFGVDGGSDFANGPDTADFGDTSSGDSGGSDSGSSDSGGWDGGGSSDSGGWDSGGSDSGGGDFGGGGGDF